VTVIAYKNGIMAADTMEIGVNGETPSWGLKGLSSRKIIKQSGHLVGVAGKACPSVQDIKKWFFDPEFLGEDVRPRLKYLHFLLLNVTPDRRIVLWDHLGTSYAVSSDRHYAIGAGQEFAMGAMDAGASAARAVQIAINRCPQCDGRVTTKALADASASHRARRK
jgi:hypothetical protein